MSLVLGMMCSSEIDVIMSSNQKLIAQTPGNVLCDGDTNSTDVNERKAFLNLVFEAQSRQDWKMYLIFQFKFV